MSPINGFLKNSAAFTWEASKINARVSQLKRENRNESKDMTRTKTKQKNKAKKKGRIEIKVIFSIRGKEVTNHSHQSIST